MTAWSIFTVILIAKMICAAVTVAASTMFLVARRRRGGDSSQTSCGSAHETVLFIVVPLLREQRTIAALFRRLVAQLDTFPELRIIFVTTEREILDDPETLDTTPSRLRQLICDYKGDRDRIILLHYPSYNCVVAEQLNYGVSHIARLQKDLLPYTYVMFYNADSIIDARTIVRTLAQARNRVPVIQQSAIFVANVPQLLQQRRYYLAAHGLYQSSWTLQHELPRYLFSRKIFSCIPRSIARNSLVHCVTHGLCIRMDALTEVGGFPVTVLGGEDLCLGFLLKVHGYDVVPLSVLENATTPDSVRALWRQLAGWFLATTGYVMFWRFLRPDVRRRRRAAVWVITALGLEDSLKWLLKGALIVLYIYLGYLAGHLAITIILYLIYVYTSLAALMWLWRRLPVILFPRPPILPLLCTVVLYWVIPIVRSGPAVRGLWWAVRIMAGVPFTKPKTEGI